MIRPATRRVLLAVAPLCWAVALVATMTTADARDEAIQPRDFAFAPVEIQIAADVSASPTATAPASIAPETPTNEVTAAGFSVPWEIVVGGILGLFIGIWFIPRLPKRQK
jgi:hypothetical protein